MDKKAEMGEITAENKENGVQNVLVTGGAGFIGSNTLCFLLPRYPNIRFVCLDKLNPCSSIKNLDEIKDCPNLLLVKGDITSSDFVDHLIVSQRIDTILHFAGQSHVDNSFGNSFEFTIANVFGTHVLLESARIRKSQIKLFIHASTDEVYGESTDGLDPKNPYSATKLAAEFLAKSYRHSFGLPLIITRSCNVYGPRQHPEKIIPKFINLLMRGHPCPLHGNGQNRRSFLYITDVALAFEVVLFKGVIGEVYNIGSCFEIANIDTLRRVLKLFNLQDRETDYITFVEDRAFNDFRYQVKPLGLESLGWKPLVEFDDGLKMTKEWYEKNTNYWPNIKSALKAHPVLL